MGFCSLGSANPYTDQKCLDILQNLAFNDEEVRSMVLGGGDRRPVTPDVIRILDIQFQCLNEALRARQEPSRVSNIVALIILNLR